MTRSIPGSFRKLGASMQTGSKNHGISGKQAPSQNQAPSPWEYTVTGNAKWRYFTLNSDHYCMLKNPEELAELLLKEQHFLSAG